MAQGPEEKVAKAKAERGAKRRSKMKVSNIQERTAVIEKLDPEEKSNSLFREEEQPRELKAPPKKKRKLGKGAWQETKASAKDIADASLEAQAQWLWDSFADSTGSSVLERAGLEESSMQMLVKEKAFQESLMHFKLGKSESLAATSSKVNGSPLILIIAGSANELAKKLPSLNQACRVAKLFAKHFKVDEQEKELQARCVNIAVGTPNRIAKLAELGALNFGRLKLIVIDCALDAKERTVLDIPEVRKDLWALFQKHLKSYTASGQCKIGLVDSHNF